MKFLKLMCALLIGGVAISIPTVILTFLLDYNFKIDPSTAFFNSFLGLGAIVVVLISIAILFAYGKHRKRLALYKRTSKLK